MCDNLCLEESCLTFALKKDFSFISSFPGFFMFGSITKGHYEKNKYFRFSYFDLPKLYSAILKMIQFLADDSETLVKTEVIIKEIDTKSLTYFIIGKTNIDQKKVVKFGLERELEVFELSFSYFELNDFLFSLTDIVITCLCVKPIEKEMILKVISLPLEDLIAYQNFNNAKQYLSSIYEKNLCATLIENMTTVLVYYNYIVIILHKFKSLVNRDILIQNDNQTTLLLSVNFPLQNN